MKLVGRVAIGMAAQWRSLAGALLGIALLLGFGGPVAESASDPADNARVQIELTRFRCLNANEDSWYSNGDEPYLWVGYFIVDGHGVDLSNLASAHARVHSPSGSHGNLGRSGVTGGTGFAIPRRLGRYDASIRPIAGLPPRAAKDNTLAGVAVVAIEEDGTPDGAAEDGRREFVRALRDELNAAIRSLSRPDASAMQARIRQRVHDRMEDSTLSRWWGDFWGFLTGVLDPDDLVGADYKIVTYRQLEDAGRAGMPFTLRFRRSGVHYQVDGKFTLVR